MSEVTEPMVKAWPYLTGIVLCTQKEETIVKYSVPAENNKLFAVKYRLCLPQEEELIQLIESNMVNFEPDEKRNSFHLMNWKKAS